MLKRLCLRPSTSKIFSIQVEGVIPMLPILMIKFCDTCQLGKQTRVSFKPKNIVSTFKPLELLHMDLFDPTRTTSLGGNIIL